MIDFPQIDWILLLPVMVVLGTAAVQVLIEAFVPRQVRRPIQLALTFASLVIALGFTILNAGAFQLLMDGALAADGPALFLQGGVLIIAVLAGCLMVERGLDPVGDAFAPRASAMPGSEDERQFTARGYEQTEIWPLFGFAVGGMMLFVAANDLLTMFIALEIMSLPLYLMAGMARRRRLLSQEAALKYFVLGAFSSAFFVYGAALLYGFSGSVTFADIAQAVTGQPNLEGLLLAGIAFLAVGLFFKVAAVPFHGWAPDVYTGSPTAITAFMAAGVKVAAFGAMLRVMYVALGGAAWDWRPVFWVIAGLTFFVGAFAALAQQDIKRMLAYSSIVHAGFLILGVAAVSPEGLRSSMFYLVTYGVATVAAFGLLTLVRNENGEATTLESWRGLGRTNPWLGISMAFLLLSFAGIPLTTGFIAKYAIFDAAAQSGSGPMVVLAVIASAVAAFFYIRLIVVMYFSDPVAEGPSVVVPSWASRAAIGFGVAATLVLGVFPEPVLDLAAKASLFVQ